MVINYRFSTSSSFHLDIIQFIKGMNDFDDMTLDEIDKLQDWAKVNYLELNGNPYYASELYDCDEYDGYEDEICEFLIDGLKKIRSTKND